MFNSLAILVSTFIGVGQNLPYDQLYFFGIGIGDALFLLALGLTMLDDNERSSFINSAIGLKKYAFSVLFLFFWVSLSSTFNAFTYGLEANDIVEIVRYLYYLLLIIYISQCVEKYGLSVLIAFCVGILISGFAAYVNPKNDDVLGSVMLWNPNVIGNMLALGIFFSSLLMLDGRVFISSFFVAAFLILAAFSFSKGTWIMCVLGLVCMYLAAIGMNNFRTKKVAKMALSIFVFFVVFVVIEFHEQIYAIYEFKIATTQIGSSAAEGGTSAARFGFVLASLRMVIENPLLGVGISNYEKAYSDLEAYLGNYYWPTDNPHSAWLYVLACIGIPALISFTGIFSWVFADLGRVIPIRDKARRIYLFCSASIFFLSGAVMLQIITGYFFWFFIGVVSGMGRRLPRENYSS